MNDFGKHQRDAKIAFKEIWETHPELQNWSSSMWWFFLFLPEQEDGYGPDQMMFTYASRQGKLIKVGDTWQKGFKLDRERKNPEEFMTTIVGWIRDEKGVHEKIVHQPAMAQLDRKNQTLSAWDKGYGATIKASEEHELGIDGYFEGPNGYAKFTIWNDINNEHEFVGFPSISDIRGPAHGKIGGTHLVAWRKFNFIGEFKSPAGVNKRKGIGYFQRVLMNIPMQPWKWSFMAFADGSLFSSFMLFAGLNHHFRRDYKFFKSNFIERIGYDIVPTAYYYDAKENKLYTFKTARTEIELHKDFDGEIDTEHPNFYLEARGLKEHEDDFIRMYTKTHGHAQFLLDRRVIEYLWQTKYNYNEYMYKVVKLKARINNEDINLIDKHGQLYGNIEYCFGWSI